MPNPKSSPAKIPPLSNNSPPSNDRFQPQGPEEVALIDCAISSDWLLRRLRKAEAEMWNRSIAEHEANLFKWGQKPEQFPVAAAFLDEQKAFDRLQRRISAAERSLRASLETLARLRKQGGTGLPACQVGQAVSPGQAAEVAPPEPPVTSSNQTSIHEIGFVPEIRPAPSPEHAVGPAISSPASVPEPRLPGSPPPPSVL